MINKIIFILCCFILINSSLGQNYDKFKKINWRIYHQLNFSDYVDIHSTEWKSMSIKVKDSLLQIPENELKAMSTKELIEAYINCRFARNFFLWPNVTQYYDELFSAFNGTRELLDRVDAPDELIKYYKNMNPIENTISLSGVPVQFQIQFIEYLIGNPSIVEKINIKQLYLFISELVKKYEIKREIPSTYIENLQSNIYAISQLLSHKDMNNLELYNVNGISLLRKSGRIPNKNISTQIIYLANKFLGN